MQLIDFSKITVSTIVLMLVAGTYSSTVYSLETSAYDKKATSYEKSTSMLEINENRSDEEINVDVKNRIASDKMVSSLNVNVKTKNRVVRLVGRTNTNKELSRLVEIAESVPGVKDVDTKRLTVKDSKQPVTDTIITAKTKGKFLREKLFGDAEVPVMTINVETKNGIVYLTGTAESSKQADQAIAIAESVDGVKGVNSTIVIKPKDRS